MVEYSCLLSVVTSSQVQFSRESVVEELSVEEEEEEGERMHVERSDSLHGHSLDVPVFDAQSFNSLDE